MKNRKIIKIICFVSVLFVLLYSLSKYFASFNYHKYSIYHEIENSLDYLSIGDSESYTTISPMHLYDKKGYVGYNLGASGQHLQDTYFELNKALELQKPKVILFETNAIFNNSTLLQEWTKVNANVIANIAPIFNSHNWWKEMIKFKFKRHDINPKEQSSNNVLKGFYYNNSIVPYSGKNYIYKSDKRKEIGPIQKEYLNKIINLCKDNNIKLIFFSAPSPVNWTYQRHNTINDIATKENLEYVDLNLKLKELNIDWSKDTYDAGDHVNYYGSIKVGNYMADYLAKTGFLESKKEDSNYSYWDLAMERYNLIVQGS